MSVLAVAVLRVAVPPVAVPPLADRLELRRRGFGPHPPVDEGLLRLLELVLKLQARVLQPDPVLALLVRDK